MSVVVEAAKGRKTNFELNLVPFIDLLSVQITFLLATAVWLQVSSLPVDQGTGDSASAVELQTLTIRLPATGLNWSAIRSAVIADRAAHPEARDVVLETEDGVPYEAFVAGLDLLRLHGYDRPALTHGR